MTHNDFWSLFKSSKFTVDRKEKLLNIADELFGRYGYERTKMDDVAQEAGISKGAVYLDFKSKESLLIGVVHRNMDEQLSEIKNELTRCNRNYINCLKSVLRKHILFIFQRVNSQHHSLDSLINTSHQIRKNSLFYFEEKSKIIAAFLEKASEAGEIPRYKNYDKLTYQLMTTLSGLYPPYEPKSTVRPDEKITQQELEETTDFILDLIFSGLQHFKPSDKKG